MIALAVDEAQCVKHGNLIIKCRIMISFHVAFHRSEICELSFLKECMYLPRLPQQQMMCSKL